MKRLGGMILAMIILLTLAVPAFAATEATAVRFQAAISGDGSAQITVSVNLRLETAQKDLTFPVPANARNVTVNGAKADTVRRGEAKRIDLSETLGKMAGEFTFTVNYILDDVVTTNEAGLPMVELPILSGFAYPVANLEFTVSLPDTVEAKPAFSSGYHHSSIEEDLRAAVSGNLITGQSLKALKDQETLVMTLDVPETMFPDTPIVIDSSLAEVLAVTGCLVLALLYWLIFLRTGPLRRRQTPTPPDGFGAGELGSLLCLEGADLTLTVFTWAQLGYILIQPDRNGRVLLHKRMEMGNERSEFEQRLFARLFGKRSVVDATSGRYADLAFQSRTLSSGARSMLERSSGNPRIFRFLGACAAAVCGFYVGFALAEGGVLRWLWGIVMGLLGLYSGLKIQRFAGCLFLLRKTPVYKALAWCVLWLGLGLLAGQFPSALALTLSQLAVGLMAAYGGRRTQEGRRVAGNVLGLRKYLKSLSYQDLRRLSQSDPELFHNLAPYALALGVDKRFAGRFGQEGIPGCPYLTTGMDGHRNAREWAMLMRRTIADMDRRERQKNADRLRKALRDLKK